MLEPEAETRAEQRHGQGAGRITQENKGGRVLEKKRNAGTGGLERDNKRKRASVPA